MVLLWLCSDVLVESRHQRAWADGISQQLTFPKEPENKILELHGQIFCLKLFQSFKTIASLKGNKRYSQTQDQNSPHETAQRPAGRLLTQQVLT